MMPSAAIIEVTRNTIDNGPAPAFFVVGTVVTAGIGVVTGVVMTVVAGDICGVSITEDPEPVVTWVVTAVLLTGTTDVLPVPVVPEDDDTYPALPPLPPDEPPEYEYVGMTVIAVVSKTLPFAIKSSFSEFPLLKGTVWNAVTPPTINVMVIFPALTSSSVEDTISLGSKLFGPPYSPSTVVVNSPRGTPFICAMMTVPEGAGLPFRYTDP